MADIKKCFLCNADSISVLFNKIEKGINTQIFKCQHCGVLFIHPQAVPDINLESYYQGSLPQTESDKKRFAKKT